MSSLSRCCSQRLYRLGTYTIPANNEDWWTGKVNDVHSYGPTETYSDYEASNADGHGKVSSYRYHELNAFAKFDLSSVTPPNGEVASRYACLLRFGPQQLSRALTFAP